MQHTLEKPRNRDNQILIALGILAAVAYVYLFPRVYPVTDLNLEITRSEAVDLAQTYLGDIRYDTFDFNPRAFTINHQELGVYLAEQIPDPAIRDQLNAHQPEFHWRVVFQKKGTSELFNVDISPSGDILGFENKIPTDIERKRVPFARAGSAAKRFLSARHKIDWAEYQNVQASHETQEARFDYTFKWKKREILAKGAQQQIWIRVQGDRIGGWGREVVLPSSFQEEFRNRTNSAGLLDMGMGLVILITVCLSLIFFMLKLRNNELSFKVAFKWAALSLPIMIFAALNEILGAQEAIEGILEKSGDTGQIVMMVILQILQTVLTVGILLPVLWTSGEAMTRDPWPEKLHVFDGLFNGNVFFPEYGRAVLRGFCLAFCWSALYLLLVFVFAGEDKIQLSIATNSRVALSTLIPAAYPATKGAFLAVIFVPFIVFLPALARRFISRDNIAVLVVILLFHPFVTMHEYLRIYDLNLQLLTNILVAAVLHIFYMRYEVFTILVGVFVMNTLDAAMIYVYQQDPGFRMAGGASIALLAVFFLHGFLAVKRGKTIDIEQMAPSYSKFVSERKRLKAEMDFARRVQLKMLPQSIPRVPKLEIVVLSEPAKDVGGDYYDFIELENGRLGVVVGDVTGKGLSSCMYMTLTKGMFLAHAGSYLDTEEMLGQVNKSYYQAADRRVFVSLLYCVLDPDTGLVEYVRAGHEPMILRKAATGKTELLRPIGMAVGLAPTEIFEKSLRSDRVALENGDMLIMYTDGLTEGINKDGEAFGLDRLIQIIEDEDESAWHLLERIDKEHKAFVGRAEQHDDITCLVIQLREDLTEIC